MTNAPIFTTIDNGELKIDLASEQLKIKCKRDFRPEPRITLQNSEVIGLFLKESNPRIVLTRSQLEKNFLSSIALSNDTYFGKNVFVLKNTKTNKDIEYYYKFGEAYLKMCLKEEDDEGNMVDVPTIEEWFQKSETSETKFYRIKFQLTEVRRK